MSILPHRCLLLWGATLLCVFAISAESMASTACKNAIDLEKRGRVEELKKAAEAKDSCAARSLSRYFLHRRNRSKKDTYQAIRFAEIAAKTGSASAQFELGTLFLGLEPDLYRPKAAVYWLHKAADQQHIPAQTLLGRLYLQGEIVKKDIREGFGYLIKAYEGGGAEAHILIEKMISDAITSTN